MNGGRLCQPKHCSALRVPVLKAVYHSSFHDKHNFPWWNSFLDTLQLGMLLLNLCKLHVGYHDVTGNDIPFVDEECTHPMSNHHLVNMIVRY